MQPKTYPRNSLKLTNIWSFLYNKKEFLIIPNESPAAL